MAPSHRKITFCFLPQLLLLLLLLTTLLISALLEGADCLATSGSRSSSRATSKSNSIIKSSSNNSKSPSKRQTNSKSQTTTTTTITPNEIVYKFVEGSPPPKSRSKKATVATAKPEREPEERELGYYGVYDHIGAPVLKPKKGEHGYGRRISGYSKPPRPSNYKLLLFEPAAQTFKNLGLDLGSQQQNLLTDAYNAVVLNDGTGKCEFLVR